MRAVALVLLVSLSVAGTTSALALSSNSASIALTHRWKDNPDEGRAFVYLLRQHQARHGLSGGVAPGALVETQENGRHADHKAEHGHRTAMSKEILESMRSTVTKNGKALSEAEVEQALDLVNHYNFFTGKIAVGTGSNQMYDVIFDTGSSYLMIPSVYCEGGGSCSDHGFDPTKSRTYESQTPLEQRKQGKFNSVEIHYASGSVLGVVGKDTVSVGSLKIPGLVFGQIISDKLSALGEGFEGVCGIGAPHANGDHPPLLIPNLLETSSSGMAALTDLVSENKLARGTYGFFMSNRPNNPGSLTVGSAPDNIKGKFTTLPLLKDRTEDHLYWEVAMSDIKVGGESLDLCTGVECSAVLDTGTSLIIGEPDMMSAILSGIEVDPDCKNINDLPDISFVLNGVEHKLEPKDYVLISPADTMKVQRIQLGPFSINLPLQYSDSIVCAIGLAANDAMSEIDASIATPRKRVILGGTFLRKFVTVYDYDKKAVDVAEADHGDHDKPIDVVNEFPALKKQYEDEAEAAESEEDEFWGSEPDSEEEDEESASSTDTDTLVAAGGDADAPAPRNVLSPGR